MPERGHYARRYPRLSLIALVVALASVAGGCVHRRMTIRTNPPGAAVYVDDYPIGTSPVSTSFIYYGTRKIRIVKDGYETLTVERKISPPWYQYFPLDFVSENVVPTEIRDERVLDFTLSPQLVVPTDELVGRAEQMRASGRNGVILTGAEVPPGPQSQLPLPGQPTPSQLGSEPVPGLHALPPGVPPPPPTVIHTLPPASGSTLPPPGVQTAPTLAPGVNPFSRPTVPPPTPGLPPPGAYPQ